MKPGQSMMGKGINIEIMVLKIEPKVKCLN